MAAEPPSAATLQATLRNWFVNLAAPALTLPAPPLTITADGKDYRLDLSLAAMTGNAQDKITARLRPREGGKLELRSGPPAGKGHDHL